MADLSVVLLLVFSFGFLSTRCDFGRVVALVSSSSVSYVCVLTFSRTGISLAYIPGIHEFLTDTNNYIVNHSREEEKSSCPLLLI